MKDLADILHGTASMIGSFEIEGVRMDNLLPHCFDELRRIVAMMRKGYPVRDISMFQGKCEKCASTFLIDSTVADVICECGEKVTTNHQLVQTGVLYFREFSKEKNDA
jgi:hypothetical protein